jgi:hypothetical protein
VDREELTDGLHALSQTYRYYGKEIDDTQITFWKHAMKRFELGDFKRALHHHIENSRYAPKISDIKESLSEMRENRSLEFRQQALPEKPVDVAPPHVAKAWAYVIRQWGGDASKLFADPKLNEEESESALMLCNEQACKNMNPEAIPPHCWLGHVWGCTRDEAIKRTPS